MRIYAFLLNDVLKKAYQSSCIWTRLKIWWGIMKVSKVYFQKMGFKDCYFKRNKWTVQLPSAIEDVFYLVHMSSKL